jgi:hypothetical protein
VLTIRDAQDYLGMEDPFMEISQEILKPQRDPYLEVRVQENASKAEVDDIVEALATISIFFGVRLEGNGGGSGGNPIREARSNVEKQPSPPEKPLNVIRQPPDNNQHDRIGDRG